MVDSIICPILAANANAKQTQKCLWTITADAPLLGAKLRSACKHLGCSHPPNPSDLHGLHDHHSLNRALRVGKMAEEGCANPHAPDARGGVACCIHVEPPVTGL